MWEVELRVSYKTSPFSPHCSFLLHPTSDLLFQKNSRFCTWSLCLSPLLILKPRMKPTMCSSCWWSKTKYVFFVRCSKATPQTLMCGTRRILKGPDRSSQGICASSTSVCFRSTGMCGSKPLVCKLPSLKMVGSCSLWCYLSLLSASRLMWTIVMCPEHRSLTDHASPNAF
jgi:hypothetical protein